jgi:Gamma tubulin complex component C-terminal
MIHFIRQMAAFCQLEVVECSWKALVDFTSKKEGDLDALIGAHRAYLDRMVKKILLIGPKAGREVRPRSDFQADTDSHRSRKPYLTKSGKRFL